MKFPLLHEILVNIIIPVVKALFGFQKRNEINHIINYSSLRTNGFLVLWVVKRRCPLNVQGWERPSGETKKGVMNCLGLLIKVLNFWFQTI